MVKVVRVEDDGKLVSVLALGKAMVEYKPGEWVESPAWLAEKGYFLTVFDSVKHAKKFIYRNSFDIVAEVEIWECETDGVVDNMPRRGTLPELGEGIISIPTSGNPPWPAGTVMARRVRLTKRVWWLL